MVRRGFQGAGVGAGRQVRRMQGRREKTWLKLERDQWKERML